MKAEIMKLTNLLLAALEQCCDETLTDRVCAAVSYNEPFEEEEIAAVQEEVES